MQPAVLPPYEDSRLEALRGLLLLDTPAEQEFDDITSLAACICETPIALISLVDQDRQWFKSRVGLAVPQTPRNVAFCAHAILGDDILEVQDATEDPRFADNPIVTSDPFLRFYAGIPLKTTDNYNVGTLCVIDRVPRALSEQQRNALSALGRQVMRLVELRQLTRLQEQLRSQLAGEIGLNRAIIENAGVPIIATDLDAIIKTYNPAAETLLGYTAQEMISKASPVSLFHVPEEIAARGAELSARYGETIEGLDIFLRPLRDSPADTAEWTYRCKDGRRISVLLTLSFLRDDAGEPFGYLGVIRDLTERRELEAQQRLRFESETLLKEIHHRVKNNMQVISSLLSIQAGKLKDADQRDVFYGCRERIRAMSLIHDRLYTTGQYSGIDFGDYLREMIPLIMSSSQACDCVVDVNLEVEPVFVEIEKAVPLSLIASELVLNAIKHAFRDRRQGVLRVRLTQGQGICSMSVSDDGPGMGAPSPDLVGVGMQLITGLVRQIKGRYELAPGPGVATTISWTS